MAVGVAASVTYGGIIVVLLWMNDAMARMMTATTPTKLRAWGEGGNNTTMSTTMRLGAGVNTTIRCMKGDNKTWRPRTKNVENKTQGEG